MSYRFSQLYNLQAVHTKYKTKKLLQVALMPELKSPIVRYREHLDLVDNFLNFSKKPG